jgi:hypothetical protein
MNTNLKFILLTIFTFGVLGLAAQNQEGHLIMEITDATSNNEQMAPQLEMMKGSVTEVHYKDGQSLTTMNLMGGMVVTKILLEKSGDLKLIMDMMGQKMLIPMSKMELEKSKATGENPMSELDITYDETDTKEIAGFPCYKMNAKSKSNPDLNIEAYITDRIKANAAVIQGVDLEMFKGFPLEYTVDMGMIKMTTSAKEYNEKVDASVFDINTKGYTTMTMEEFMNSMGGMGKGFGF